ncbi:hypothetical protein SAMN02746041_03213 [Desulfacinum hydrothermale DSM 13146]|uniref:Plasmid and phage replicative helicase n=1 Tax=Desulfacinum hydrothermale DSM 13146 TaxID=1121390 RepID=A0A1W1XWL4_9BACT|nr:helicase RepA family protein [Desulfacinum hydrothermale]SMC28255.1 hypothetical protein SAMN02746041_03213 [Desulfacinum hydrothermale DSM 13146]
MTYTTTKPILPWLDIKKAITEPAKPLDYVLPGLKSGTVGTLVSPGGSGKSMFALEAAVTVAGGPDLLALTRTGWKHTTGRVVYLTAEDGEDILGIRLKSIGAFLNSSELTTICENLYIAPLDGYGVDIMNRFWKDYILNETYDARLVIFDTLRCFHRLEENSSGEMTLLVEYMKQICRTNNTTIIFLHHTNKMSALNNVGDVQQASRGSSVLTDNVRWQSYLVGMSKSEAKKYKIPEALRGYYVRFGIAKQNYGPPIPDQWYKRYEGGVLRPVDPESEHIYTYNTEACEVQQPANGAYDDF